MLQQHKQQLILPVDNEFFLSLIKYKDYVKRSNRFTFDIVEHEYRKRERVRH